jgi:hypothetical protein
MSELLSIITRLEIATYLLGLSIGVLVGYCAGLFGGSKSKMSNTLLTQALREREANLIAKHDKAWETLREIAAADWKTSGELRGMAKKLLEGKK